jgi:hypothetical protein
MNNVILELKASIKRNETFIEMVGEELKRGNYGYAIKKEEEVKAAGHFVGAALHAISILQNKNNAYLSNPIHVGGKPLLNTNFRVKKIVLGKY